jgi:hypothetical protein
VTSTFFLLLLVGPAKDWRPPELHVAERVPVMDFAELKEIALEYVGRPYVSAGVGNPGFDCSGFTCRVFAEAGYAIPRVSRDQARSGREVPLEAIAPGDLLFFVQEPGSTRINHVAIYLGDGELIHAASGQGKVVISKLTQRWYRERFVAARRALPDPGTPPSEAPLKPPPEVASLELNEHDGADALPPMLRLPARIPDPSLGPELSDFGATSIGIRAAVATENGAFGAVIAPEAMLVIESIALELLLAAPIRFEPGEKPTLGELETFADWTRFIRTLSLGLRGADLELRLARLGDASLAGGFIVDHVQPGSDSSGVPGLSIDRSPLTFFFGYRDRSIELDALVDDVVGPGVSAAGMRFSLIPGLLRAGVAVATDQRAETASGGRRAINAAEVAIFADAIETHRWSVTAAALGAIDRARGTSGIGGALSVDAELRLARGGTKAISLAVKGSRLGDGFLDAIFGPTYFAARSLHLEALGEAGDRYGIGGELSLRFDSLVIGAGFHDAIDGHPLDRRAFALFELRDISVWDTRLFDLRLAYAIRGPWTASTRADVLHGALRLRLAQWLYAEAYLANAEAVEGGAGLVVAWIP